MRLILRTLLQECITDGKERSLGKDRIDAQIWRCNYFQERQHEHGYLTSYGIDLLDERLNISTQRRQHE